MIAQLEVGYLVELGTGETLLAKFSDSQPSDETGMAVTYAKAPERRNDVPAFRDEDYLVGAFVTFAFFDQVD